MNKSEPRGLIILFLVIGLILFIGSKTYRIIRDYANKDYIETTASFIKSNLAETSDDEKSMYTLIYTYTVDGKQYYYETNYSTEVIPKKGSEIKIKYNPIMPNEAYSNFDSFSLFQIIGAFFMSIPLIILFSNIIWLRDLIMFLFTAGTIITLLINKFYYGAFIIVIIVLGIFCFGSIMDLISYLKNNKFQPLEDIKDEINRTKKIRTEKKKAKQNLSQKEIEFKLKKKNKIIKGILLFIIPLPLHIFIDVKFGYPNQIIYWICVLITMATTFVGFCTIFIPFEESDITDKEDKRKRYNIMLKDIIRNNILYNWRNNISDNIMFNYD